MSISQCKKAKWIEVCDLLNKSRAWGNVLRIKRFMPVWSFA